MRKPRWQKRRALARRLVAMRAALRAARQSDHVDDWRDARVAFARAARAQSDLLHAYTPTGAASAWRLARVESRILAAVARLAGYPPR
jgi:hypothetical protein